MSNNVSNKNTEVFSPEPLEGDQNTDNILDVQRAAVRDLNDAPRFVPPTHGGVDILKLLTELEDMVENAPKMMGVVLRFPEDPFHMAIMKIRANLPEEMKRASKLVREQERIVEETRENSMRIMEDTRRAALSEFEQGKAEAAKLRATVIAETTQLRETTRAEAEHLRNAARSEATHVCETAQQEAAQMRREAEAALDMAQRAANREAEEIEAAARTQGAEIVEESRRQALQLISESEITQQAQARARETQTRAEAEAQAVRQGADDYARDVLANLETVLGKAVAQIQRGREMLDRAH